MKYHTVIALFVCFIFSGSGVADASITLKKDEFGRLLVPVDSIRGEQRFFLFDTASGRSAIFNVSAHLYGVKQYDGGIRHLGSAGLRRVPVGSIRSLSVGGIKRWNHIVALYTYRGYKERNDTDIVSGSIGFDAFRGTVVHVKPQTSEMILSANSGYLDRSKWGLVAGYPSSNASILMDFSYEGVAFKLLLATGFNRSAINYTALRTLKPGVNPKGIRPRKTLSRGLEINEQRYGTLKLPNLDINGWDLGDLEVVVAPITSKELVGYPEEPLLILGADVLTTRELVFDFRDFQLWYPLPVDKLITNLQLIAK